MTWRAPQKRSAMPAAAIPSDAAFHRTIERMNRYERRPYDAGEAEVEYLDGDFKVRRPGAYCTLRGVRASRSRSKT
jgi:hypothetical protein